MPKGFPRLLMERVTASAQSVKFRDALPRLLRTRRAQAQIAVGYRQVFLDGGYRLHAGMEPRVNLLAWPAFAARLLGAWDNRLLAGGCRSADLTLAGRPSICSVAVRFYIGQR